MEEEKDQEKGNKAVEKAAKAKAKERKVLAALRSQEEMAGRPRGACSKGT